MPKPFFSLAGVVASALIATVTSCAHADKSHSAAQPQAGGAQPSAPIPTAAEGQPVAVEGGGYCYAGPHPVDTRHAAGPPWDESPGRHVHNYPPFDLRLFTHRDGCYHFVGDPKDFGYRGRVYSYYGAHPVHDHHGGGWCFMIGGHSHFWEPWSPHFTVVGPWYYWHGPYDDPFFWSYWPYYSFYYRDYYPRYYGDGRFHRGRDVAPPIRNVPAPRVADGWRGERRAGGGWRGESHMAPPAAAGATQAPPPEPRSSRGFERGGPWVPGGDDRGLGSRNDRWSRPTPAPQPSYAPPPPPAPSSGSNGGGSAPPPRVPGGSSRGWRR